MVTWSPSVWRAVPEPYRRETGRSAAIGDMRPAERPERGLEMKLLGSARFDRKQGVSSASRWWPSGPAGEAPVQRPGQRPGSGPLRSGAEPCRREPAEHRPRAFPRLRMALRRDHSRSWISDSTKGEAFPGVGNIGTLMPSFRQGSAIAGLVLGGCWICRHRQSSRDWCSLCDLIPAIETPIPHQMPSGGHAVPRTKERLAGQVRQGKWPRRCVGVTVGRVLLQPEMEKRHVRVIVGLGRSFSDAKAPQELHRDREGRHPCRRHLIDRVPVSDICQE